jgi:hypothetical protein
MSAEKQKEQIVQHWGAKDKPLPLKWVSNSHRSFTVPNVAPLNFTVELRKLVTDVVARVPLFAHINPAAILYTFTWSRTRSKYGLLARITPMRFAEGRVYKQVRGKIFQVQRFFVDQQELLYVFTCCLPRFLDQTFEEKWITIFHELYHIGQKFDGDLRRHDGRYKYHTHSQKGYDAGMGKLVREYLAIHPDPSAFAFLHLTFDQLWSKHGGIYGVKVPRPRMIGVSQPPEKQL